MQLNSHVNIIVLSQNTMSQPRSSVGEHAAVPPLTSASLKMFSYLSQPLVAQTRNFFETKALLLLSQLKAKDDFLFLFRLGTLEELAECLDVLFRGPAHRRRRRLCGKKRVRRDLEFKHDIFVATPPTGDPEWCGDVHAPTSCSKQLLDTIFTPSRTNIPPSLAYVTKTPRAIGSETGYNYLVAHS